MEIEPKNTLSGGNGALVGIELKGGIEAGKKFIEALKMFYHVANIGDARSLAIHPATTTHSQLNEEELLASGVTPGYVRLCIGLEHIDDIIEDLEQALRGTADNIESINKAKLLVRFLYKISRYELKTNIEPNWCSDAYIISTPETKVIIPKKICSKIAISKINIFKKLNLFFKNK